MNSFSNIILIFFIYSIIGWILEVCLNLVKTKKFSNCGFFTGAYCPIYGIAAIILNCLKIHIYNPILMFIYSLIICSVIEYIISLILEKIIGIRWWDYSEMPFNINGRICLLFSIIFSIISVIIMCTLNPIIILMIDLIPKVIKFIITIIIIVIIISDLIFSTLIVKRTNKYQDVSRYADKITEISQNRIRKIINLFKENDQ